MKELYNFYRNITYFEEYDENSFIGIWLDYSVWNDDEYWKLEDSLLLIAELYRNNGVVSQDILLGVMRIIQILMVPHWDSFICVDNDGCNIYDRYERFKYIISILFSDDEIKRQGFFYDRA